MKAPAKKQRTKYRPIKVSNVAVNYKPSFNGLSVAQKIAAWALDLSQQRIIDDNEITGERA